MGCYKTQQRHIKAINKQLHKHTFNIATDAENTSVIEEYGTPLQQVAEINGMLQNVATSNQQAITQAHQQQREREEEGGTGLLRGLGRGASRVQKGRR